MPISFRKPNSAKEEWGALLIVASISVLFHLVCISSYGYFRDELYYLACTKHLEWGYVDHPPLCVWVLKVTTSILGDSLAAVRLISVFSTACTILVTGLLTARLGGGKRAQIAAACVVLTAPVYLVVTHLYSMNSGDVLLWALCVYCFVRSFQENSTFYWCCFGFFLGFALLNKLDVLWLVAGLGLGLLFSEDRRELVNWRPWLGLAIAGVMFLPFVLWQMGHHWPTLEFVKNANAYKLQSSGPIQFVLTQVVVMGPVSAIVWFAGIRAGLGKREWRPLPIAFLTVVLILLINGRSRENYLSPAYILVVPLGAIWLDRRFFGQEHSALRVLSPSICAVGLLTLPLALPLLSPQQLTGVYAALPRPPASERGSKGPLQGFSDMFGWAEQVQSVARVFHSLSPADQRVAAVYAQNYGEAGAIDHFGPRLGLPAAMCPHNSYWLWGTHGWDGRVVVTIGHVPDSLLRCFGSVTKVASSSSPLATPEEASAPIYVCRGLRGQVAEFWGRAKHFE